MLGNLALLVLLSRVEMGLWQGAEREFWKALQLGAVASISLVPALGVAFRGSHSERALAALLSALPLTCLLGPMLGGL